MLPFAKYFYDTQLDEARKNAAHPSQKRMDAIETLAQYAKDKDVHITYTILDKVGINPNSQFPDTPLAVFTYPLAQVWKDLKSHGITNVPFAAGRANYVYVLREKGRSVDVSDYKLSNLKSDLKSLEKMWGEESYNEIITGHESSLSDMGVGDRQHQKRIKDKPFGYLKELLYRYGDYISSSKASSYIATALIKLGYTIITDKKGTGQIHPSEPMQAFFLKSSSYDVIDKIDLKYGDKSVASVRDIRTMLKAGDTLSDADLLDAISQEPRLLKYVKNPSDDLIIHAYNTNLGEWFAPKNPYKDMEDPDKDRPSRGMVKGFSAIMSLSKISDRVFSYIAAKNFGDIVKWSLIKEKSLTSKKLNIVMDAIDEKKMMYIGIDNLVALIKKTRGVSDSDMDRYIEKFPNLEFKVRSGKEIEKKIRDSIMNTEYTFRLYDGSYPYNEVYFDALADRIESIKNPNLQNSELSEFAKEVQYTKGFPKPPKQVSQRMIKILLAYHEERKDNKFYTDGNGAGSTQNKLEVFGYKGVAIG